jgi:hypothetical protein
MARIKFHEKLINSIEKIDTITLEEKNDKAEAITSIARIIGARGLSVYWKKNKWVVAEKK